MVRIKWGGSLVSYIVVGIILVLIVSGVAYGVQSRGNQVREDKASSIASKQSKTATADQNASKNESKATTTTVTKPTSSVPTPATTVKTDTTGSTVATTSDLPQTGIEFSLTKYLGLGVLVAVVVSYVSSRRNLVRSL